MSEKAVFTESSRGKQLIVNENYKYFLAYKPKSVYSGLSRWLCCLTISQVVIHTNKSDHMVTSKLGKNVYNACKRNTIDDLVSAAKKYYF